MKTEIKKYLDSFTFMFRKEFLLSLLVFVVVGFAATFLFYKSAVDISTKIPTDKQELNSVSEKEKIKGRDYLCPWSYWPDLNRRPADYESAALPTEPQ